MTPSQQRSVLAFVTASIGLPFVLFALPCIRPLPRVWHDVSVLAVVAVIAFLWWWPISRKASAG